MQVGRWPASVSSALSALTMNPMLAVRACNVVRRNIPSAPWLRHPSDVRQYGDQRTAMRYVPPILTPTMMRVCVIASTRGLSGPVTIGRKCGTR